MISKVKLAKGLCISMVTLLMAGDAIAARARSSSDSDEGGSAKRVKPTKMVTIYISEQEGVDGAGAPIWGEKEAVKVPEGMNFGAWRAKIKAERHGIRLAFAGNMEDLVSAEEVPAGNSIAEMFARGGDMYFHIYK